MNFWDSIRGHELAETLIRTLPKMTARQKVVKINSDEEAEALAEKINSGNARFVGTFGDEYVVISEK